MSVARDSVTSYGRKRSNTHSSIRPPSLAPPLQVGDSKTLVVWTHPEDDRTILVNPDVWPGIAEGDLIEVTCQPGGATEQSRFVFIIKDDEDSRRKPRLQISLPKKLAERFKIEQYAEVLCTKVERDNYIADHVEFSFKDQYLGRPDMWRFVKFLNGQCIHVNEEITVPGVVSATVQNIFIKGQKAFSSQVVAHTKHIFRSLSAKVTIFIQVCEELWQFASDGERYYEKIVHSFLPALFSRWREAGTNHTVTIVLISRVFYDQSELDYAAGPLRQDEAFDDRWHKDFYKVITDLEIVHDWKPTLASLKDSFFAFQRDILLTHHYHNSQANSRAGASDSVRLVGKLSYAHEGPILEAINMTLNPMESHYIDRSLSMTGISDILITPGTGHFRVSKRLLRLTTSRVLDQGFGLDLVSLAKPPLHATPIFSFKARSPDLISEVTGTGRATDPLWSGEQEPTLPMSTEKNLFWWEPFWVTVTFWDLQMDLPFRNDRFVAACKMHDIQMLGLLELDIVSAIEIPWLKPFAPFLESPILGQRIENPEAPKLEADLFDNNIFTASTKDATVPIIPLRVSGSHRSPSSVGTHPLSSSVRSSMSDRIYPSQLLSDPLARNIQTIEEKSSREASPAFRQRRPPNSTSRNTLAIAKTSKEDVQSVYGSSPSTASAFSEQSNSGSSIPAPKVPSATLKESGQSLLASKLSSASWGFLNPFRQTSATPNPPKPVAPAPLPDMPRKIQESPPKSARPRNTLGYGFGGSRRTRPMSDYEHWPSHRVPQLRNPGFPVSTSPPREEIGIISRRATITSFNRTPIIFAKEAGPMNPSQLRRAVSYSHASLSKRWKDLFPQPSFKHEIKWKSLVTPGCLPLTTDFFPSQHELDTQYDVFSYDFFLEPSEIQSFLLRNPALSKASVAEARDAWALSILRGMTAWRLAQGFQFVVRPSHAASEFSRPSTKWSASFLSSTDDEHFPKPSGAAMVLVDTSDPVYMSMSNEIHRLSYVGDNIHVRRYVRRVPDTKAFEYQCLIWPKQGDGYKVSHILFQSRGFLEGYGWNRMDMLIAGYERSFSDNMKYWRTRFIILPSKEPQESTGDGLTIEESRLQGIDKLAEIFGKYRWIDPSDKDKGYPPPRFLPTWLEPSACVLDDALVSQLELVHESGPLKKKARVNPITQLTLPAVVKTMREAEPPLIRDHEWHNTITPASFTGHDMVSWLVREFSDVSTREEATEWGRRFMEQGLLEHHRAQHNFLDGHYFYRLKGEYAIPSTPRSRWWRNAPLEATHTEQSNSITPSEIKTKRLILSQQMVVDADLSRKSDQAEIVILHHDIIHNATTGFHFELHWIGTAARCIEEMIRSWQSKIDKYGLKLVEAYVDEISLVESRNPFQSFYPIPLVLPPPIISNLKERLPDGKHTARYFENALLTKQFDFVLDIEAADQYPEHIDVYYSYRRAPFTYSQYVHKSGTAFVQVLGGVKGYRFLTNRLLQQNKKEASSAEQLRFELQAFCSNPQSLAKFYDGIVAELKQHQWLPEPSPLSI